MLTTQTTITPGLAHTHITGGGGVRLHVAETGHPKWSPHSFRPRFFSILAHLAPPNVFGLGDDYRLVALDLRGHGQSDKPREGYADRRLWAADILAVTRELRIEQPVLCGWSYGPIVILDYVREAR
jgi:pimeloyl-ACP methyl ester carboxylesterase